MQQEKNLCMDCEYAKDQWHGSCYCTLYGFIIYKGKKNCWGHKTKADKKEE